MAIIKRISAREILDSRGRPTISATCELEGGAVAAASIPSGASTGRAEARELRDGDRGRYSGMGCIKAVANIEGPIANAIRGKNFGGQRELDETMIKLDNSPDKLRLGANSILA